MRIINCKDATQTFPIALVVSRHSGVITQRLYDGAIDRLKTLGFKDAQICIVWVPGAGEIPLMVQHLARQNHYSAIVALGAVIRGETGQYDYLCDQASQGCLNVALDFHLPVIFGVLTTENEQQALARSGGEHSHKGVEAIDAAVELVTALAEV